MGQKFRVLLGFTVSGEHRVYPGDLVDGDVLGDAKEIRYKQERGFIGAQPVSVAELAAPDSGIAAAAAPARKARSAKKAPAAKRTKKASAPAGEPDAGGVADPFATDDGVL